MAPPHLLWRTVRQTADDGIRFTQTRDEEEREFCRIRSYSIDKILHGCATDNSNVSSAEISPLVVEKPPQRSIIEIMNSSLVVGQEIALTTFILALHRVIVQEESTRGAGQRREIARETLLVVDHLDRKSSVAMVLVYATLLVIVYFNQKSVYYQSTTKPEKENIERRKGDDRDTSDSGTTNNNNKSTQVKDNIQQTGHRRKKAIVRMTDAVLLAAILRLTSGIIRTLTASYSSDTVYALSISGMAIHILTCDYKYANGIASEVDGNLSSLHTFAHPRPAFLGGTVSLNATFFSTALLVSRIESNASSYAFVSLAVTLFAFYPATRHNIAGIYPNSLFGSPCFIITLTLSISVWLITTSLERFLFMGIQLIILLISPCIEWDLQKHKKHVSGAWDIAHISSVEVNNKKNKHV